FNVLYCENAHCAHLKSFPGILFFLSCAQVAMVQDVRHSFPTVDVPDHAHYTIGSVILAVGITGMVGNFLVMYAFCKSRSLRTPANMFIINLAVTDFLMCVTQTPIFFTTSLHKRWIFGEKGNPDVNNHGRLVKPLFFFPYQTKLDQS
ncbi:hypothetical protein cypCar_00024877, partial [Cyprinus carpio]